MAHIVDKFRRMYKQTDVTISVYFHTSVHKYINETANYFELSI